MNTLGQITIRASALRALKRGLQGAWDHLGFVLAVSLTISVSCVGLAAIGVYLARYWLSGVAVALSFLPALLFAWLGLVGVSHFAWMSVTGRHPQLAETFVGVGRLFWPAITLFVIDLATSVVLMGDAVFFLFVKGNILLQTIGILVCYLGVVWLMMAMYHLPLLAAQLDMDSGPRPTVIIRKSYLLMADNPGFTLVTFLAIIAFAVACGLTAVGVVTVLPGAAVFLVTHSLKELFIKYGIIEEEPENPPDNWNGIT